MQVQVQVGELEIDDMHDALELVRLLLFVAHLHPPSILPPQPALRIWEVRVREQDSEEKVTVGPRGRFAVGLFGKGLDLTRSREALCDQ